MMKLKGQINTVTQLKGRINPIYNVIGKLSKASSNGDHSTISIKTGYTLSESTANVIPVVYEEELQGELH